MRVAARAAMLAAAVGAVAAGAFACGDTGTDGEAGDITVTNHPALLYSPPWIAATEDDLLAKRG